LSSRAEAVSIDERDAVLGVPYFNEFSRCQNQSVAFGDVAPKYSFMPPELIETAKSLPLAERVELAEALWESITADGYEPKSTDAQIAEVQRRLAAHKADPESVVPWETLKTEMEAKLREKR
jgi:putative addiction module component (TIGR02574 family)